MRSLKLHGTLAKTIRASSTETAPAANAFHCRLGTDAFFVTGRRFAIAIVITEMIVALAWSDVNDLWPGNGRMDRMGMGGGERNPDVRDAVRPH